MSTLRKLRSETEGDRRTAKWFLGASVSTTAIAPIANSLSDMLDSDAAYERNTAAAAIEVMGSAVVTYQILLNLAQILKSGDEAKFQPAMRVIRAIGASAATVASGPVVDSADTASTIEVSNCTPVSDKSTMIAAMLTANSMKKIQEI